VSRIRRSAGQIKGLGLAVFDGLFFPLLALDAALVLICIHFLSVWRPSNLAGLQIVVATGLICLVVDWLIASAVWRRLRVASEGPARKTSGGTVALAVVIAAVVLLAGAFGPIMIRSRSPASKREEPRPTQTAEGPPPVARAEPNPPASPAAAVAAARDVEELRILLRQAQGDVADLEPRVKAGIGDSAELERAREEVAILEAQIAGDEIAAAKTMLARCERELKWVQARHDAGLTTESELRKARLAVDLARHRLARLTPPEPAPAGP
jgi:hypothetical protein